MDNFKQALIQFAHSNPNFSPNNDTNSYSRLIEQRFLQFFPDFQTPNHPPYAAMIHKAIRELNKKGSSSEESISKYIKNEYDDLPWAHTTLLKHHLEKLCDSKELCINHKQHYSLAGANSDQIPSSTSDKPLKRKRISQTEKKISGTRKKCKKTKSRPDSEPSRPAKKRKKLKSKQDLQPGKKIRKRHKKREKRIVDIQENNKQMIDVFQENQDVQPLDHLADQQEVDLRIEDLSEKILQINHEVNTSDIQENNKQMIDVFQENQDVQPLDHLADQQEVDLGIEDLSEKILQINHEVNTSDIQIQEVNKDDEMLKELQPDNYELDQVQTMQNLQLLHLEQSPNSKHVLQKSGKRIWTRSQLITMLKEPDSPSYADLTEEKEHPTEIMDGKESKQTPNAVSTRTNGQRAKLRSSQKNTVMESTDMEQDQQPEEFKKDEMQENKPKKKGRKRHPKKNQQSVKKCNGGRTRSKVTLIENQGSGKSKAINKKGQLKNKRRKMITRSSRKLRK